MREIVRLFSQAESRDELGIGQIRDALSDALFPGTSVVQTRARYFVFIPWLIADAAVRRRGSETVIERVEKNERKLIAHFLTAQPGRDGLIGSRAGPKVKILPSTIYWSGLRTFGVVPPGFERDDLDGFLSAASSRATARRMLADAPEPPAGFPDVAAGGFDMSAAESTWLRDRIATCRREPTLLSYLATTKSGPSPDASYAWDEPKTAGAPSPIMEVLRHAELFSLVMEGAALVYNRLLGVRAVEVGMGEEHLIDLDERLSAWIDKVDAERGRLRSWNLIALWSSVAEQNDRVSLRTRSFVEEWTELVRSDDDLARAALSDAAATLVRQREMQQKGRQSRFRNEKLLQAWNGEAGTGRLDFRWSTVRTLLTDLHDGLDRVPA